MTWVDWGGADTDLMDYVHRLARFRAAHPALSEDEFLTGRSSDGLRDVVWRHPEQREMRAEDWQEDAARTLGMHLDVKGDELLVWLNRWIHPVQVFCPLPRSGGAWQVGIASAGPVGFGRRAGPGRPAGAQRRGAGATLSSAVQGLSTAVEWQTAA